ncbi:hypothetical protein D9M68_690730 [compost metagenome]
MNAPTWGDLLVSLDSFPSSFGKEPLSTEQAEQLERIANSASEYSSILSLGISSIGWAIAAAADNESFGLDAGELRSLGWLLKELGDLSEALSSRHSEAEYRLHHCKRVEAARPKE